MDAPHVFVTLGDVTHVECDAWMLPTDMAYTVEGGWLKSMPELTSRLAASRTNEFSRGTTKATEVADWDPDKPLPILTAVPTGGVHTLADREELGKGIRDFVARGATLARERTSRHRRPKPLLAMPAFGTGRGGGSEIRGEVLDVLLRVSHEAALEGDTDVVLVLNDPRIFALAQQKRAKSDWPELDPRLLSKARELAAFARQGKLVPFMGAGVSVSAGGPTWDELIKRLAKRVGLTETEVQALAGSKRSALDQAAYLRERYREKSRHGSFGEAVRDAVQLERYGLAPALLASLRTEQAITLNYDELFERAAADANDPRMVIPGESSATRSGKWLLKLHGTVADPDSIVLTREDYLGYNATREALSAIVKANLITHHLLFVGFGLADDHFHRIIHDVRQSLPKNTEGGGYATALTMLRDPLDSTLWDGQLDLIPMDEAGQETDMDEANKILRAGRFLEIFLDALLVYATDSHSYILHKDFVSSLSAGEKSLRNKLLALKASATAEEKATAGWRAVERMFDELGS